LGWTNPEGHERAVCAAHSIFKQAVAVGSCAREECDRPQVERREAKGEVEQAAAGGGHGIEDEQSGDERLDCHAEMRG
jgi:hypothetical protein